MGVAVSAIAAAQKHYALPGLGQVQQHMLAILIQNLGSRRNLQDDVVAFTASALTPHAMGASFGFVVLLVAKIDECVEIIDTLNDYIAAATAIAAVGPTMFDGFFTPKANAAGAAVTAFDKNFRFVKEAHEDGAFEKWGLKRPQAKGPFSRRR